MLSALVSFLTAAAVPPGGPPGMHYGTPEAPYGYLWKYKPNGHGGVVKESCPYRPREGDILFFDDQSKFWEFLYWIGNTKPPFHTGIVIKKPDGSFAVLESGPDDTLNVFVLECVERVHTFKGVLQVRQCKVPLCPEQSRTLTDFAVAQEGKKYAMWRLLLQGTPIKTRGGPWRCSLAKTYWDRKRWLCTEIVVTAAELVGLMDPNIIKGTNTYPLDLLDDHMYTLLPVFEEAAYWCAHP
jgi:hypothetical protein